VVCLEALPLCTYGVGQLGDCDYGLECASGVTQRPVSGPSSTNPTFGLLFEGFNCPSNSSSAHNVRHPPTMPRVTPCRLLKRFLDGWFFIIFLWCALPSPTISPHERESHIQKTLGSGRPLITVNDWTTFFNRQTPSTNRAGQAYIVRWQLKQAPGDQGVLLKLGPLGDANLADIIAKANSFNRAHTGKNSSEWIPFFDIARVFEGIWTSNVEFSELCLGWFHRADSHFITHEVQGHSGSIILRFVVPQPGVLELWLEAVVTDHMDANDYAELYLIGNAPQTELQQQMFRRAWNYVKESQRESGILATFKSQEMKQVRDVVVLRMNGDLLSRTYPIRRTLLVLLAPVQSMSLYALTLALNLVPALLVILSQLGLACAGIMLSCWLRDGRPAFSEWNRHFWMTRWIPRGIASDAKKVWGPSGPVSAESEKGGNWDEENALSQQPQTVRIGRYWKR
jgi:hypothetical protein